MGDETAIVKAYAERADALVHKSKSLMIHNQEEREFVATLALEARFIDDEAEDREKEITKPLNEALKKVRQLFKDGVRTKCIAAQEIADDLLKNDWLDFEDARKKAQDIENAQRVTDGGFIPDIVFPETEKTITTPLGKITIRKDKKVSIADKMTIIRAIADCKLPLILADINLGASKRYFNAAGMTQAPGFLIEDDAIVSGRKA